MDSRQLPPQELRELSRSARSHGMGQPIMLELPSCSHPSLLAVLPGLAGRFEFCFYCITSFAKSALSMQTSLWLLKENQNTQWHQISDIPAVRLINCTTLMINMLTLYAKWKQKLHRKRNHQRRMQGWCPLKGRCQPNMIIGLLPESST